MLFVGNKLYRIVFNLCERRMVRPTRLPHMSVCHALTGSLLVAGAHHGAYVMGTDIDFQLLHSRGELACQMNITVVVPQVNVWVVFFSTLSAGEYLLLFFLIISRIFCLKNTDNNRYLIIYHIAWYPVCWTT